MPIRNHFSALSAGLLSPPGISERKGKGEERGELARGQGVKRREGVKTEGRTEQGDGDGQGEARGKTAN